jgi:hypothetical protein
MNGSDCNRLILAGSEGLLNPGLNPRALIAPPTGGVDDYLERLAVAFAALLLNLAGTLLVSSFAPQHKFANPTLQ